MENNTCAVIVSYFPDSKIFKLIESLANQVSQVIVVDNGTDEGEQLYKLRRLNDQKRIKLIELGFNKGIASALNYGIKEAKKTDVKFVLLSDQDSYYPLDYVNKMTNFFEINQSKIEIGLIAPNFYDRNSCTYAKFVRLSKFKMDFFSCDGENREQYISSFAITSGSILPIQVIDEVGYFIDELFIDHVDTEYCLRLQQNGYSTLVNPNVCIEHSVGERTVHKHLFITLKPNHHSEVRRYYIFRNGVYLANKYLLKYPSFAILNLLRMAHEYACILLHEDKKIIKTKHALKGVIHGILGKLGPLK